MKLFFSPSTGGFYDEGVHGQRRIIVDEIDQEALAEQQQLGEEDAAVAKLLGPPMRSVEVDNPYCAVPADAIEISREHHAELLAAQADGMVIIAGDGGAPIAIDRELSIGEQLEALRRKRDRDLRTTDWTQLPDALTAAKRKLWAQHRQALRDLPALIADAVAKGEAPTSVAYPEAPS